jgi:hypothetical protein
MSRSSSFISGRFNFDLDSRLLDSFGHEFWDAFFLFRMAKWILRMRFWDTYLTFQDLCDLLVLQIHGQLQVSKDTAKRHMCEICVIYLGSRGFLHMSVGGRKCNTSGRPYTI